jgi:hypothetical protein
VPENLGSFRTEFLLWTAADRPKGGRNRSPAYFPTPSYRTTRADFSKKRWILRLGGQDLMVLELDE